jgi:dienelactone hydrolase
MNRRTSLAITTFGFLLATAAVGEVATRAVEYSQDGTTLSGFVAWDDAVAGKRPGVLVVHEWWGHNEHARNQAKRLAEAGYVGFALDMFGGGKVTTHPEEAEAFVQEATRDPAVVGARFHAALEQLRQDPHVDRQRIAAIGYCFGGAIALAMARGGADLDAVVTFHGALATDSPAEPGKVQARVLVLTGEADPLVPPEQVTTFEKEMRAAGANFEIVRYPGVKHSFTNPEAGERGMEALAYDAEADEKSWQAMLDLFAEVFP